MKKGVQNRKKKLQLTIPTFVENERIRLNSFIFDYKLFLQKNMPPEKSEFELELTAQIIEVGDGNKHWLQEAIQYVVKEELVHTQSITERERLKKQITQVLDYSKTQESRILKKLWILDAPGIYVSSFNLSLFEEKEQFLSIYEEILLLLNLRYVHSPGTLKYLKSLLEKWFFRNAPVIFSLETEVKNKFHKKIRAIKIREISPEKTEDTPKVWNTEDIPMQKDGSSEEWDMVPWEETLSGLDRNTRAYKDTEA